VPERLWQAGLLIYDAVKGLDRRWQAMDSAKTGAPLGGRAHTLPNQPLSAAGHSVGKEARELSAAAAVCMYLGSPFAPQTF
jgi:hypothetical protein